jgi:hypothetical protein
MEQLYEEFKKKMYAEIEKELRHKIENELRHKIENEIRNKILNYSSNLNNENQQNILSSSNNETIDNQQNNENQLNNDTTQIQHNNENQLNNDNQANNDTVQIQLNNDTDSIQYNNDTDKTNENKPNNDTISIQQNSEDQLNNDTVSIQQNNDTISIQQNGEDQLNNDTVSIQQNNDTISIQQNGKDQLNNDTDETNNNQSNNNTVSIQYNDANQLNNDIVEIHSDDNTVSIQHNTSSSSNDPINQDWQTTKDKKRSIKINKIEDIKEKKNVIYKNMKINNIKLEPSILYKEVELFIKNGGRLPEFFDDYTCIQEFFCALTIPKISNALLSYYKSNKLRNKELFHKAVELYNCLDKNKIVLNNKKLLQEFNTIEDFENGWLQASKENNYKWKIVFINYCNNILKENKNDNIYNLVTKIINKYSELKKEIENIQKTILPKDWNNWTETMHWEYALVYEYDFFSDTQKTALNFQIKNILYNKQKNKVYYALKNYLESHECSEKIYFKFKNLL